MPYKQRPDDKRGGKRTNSGHTQTVVVWQEGDRLRIVTPHGYSDITIRSIADSGAILCSEGDEVVAIKLLSEPQAWGVFRKKVKRTVAESETSGDDSTAQG